MNGWIIHACYEQVPERECKSTSESAAAHLRSKSLPTFREQAASMIEYVLANPLSLGMQRLERWSGEH
jgi:hypothetical protein